MQLYLQLGYGMMQHCHELLGTWKQGGVVLSPRDLTNDQLRRVAGNARSHGCEPLLDPQCFFRGADHHRLTNHSYWEAISSHATGAFMGGPGTAALLGELANTARSMGINRHILPGCLADTVSDDWFAMQECIIAEAPGHFGDDQFLATVALSASAMQHEEQVEAVVERARGWNVSGFYVVAESPSGYLVDNPIWLANLLILVSGLKLLNKQVIVGYCSHQMLCLASAGADIIASGTWLNVRAFGPARFFEPEATDVSRRAVWYYCPQASSEYKMAFLDIAHRGGILHRMRPNPALGSIYADPLFAGAPPSSVNWTFTDAFRHYLACLCSQAAVAKQPSFDATIGELRHNLDSAESLLHLLHANGVAGQDRDFRDCVDVNRSALIVFERARGERLRRAW